VTSAYWSAQFIPSGLISVRLGLSPVVTGVVAAIWLGERLLTPFRLLGLGLGLTGPAVVFAQGLTSGVGAMLGTAGVALSPLSSQTRKHETSSQHTPAPGRGLEVTPQILDLSPVHQAPR
jgi:drug/metabolite transporter (DMT)-like permease